MGGRDRLGLVILAVDSLERATRFYGDVFGWPVAVSVPVYTEYALPDGMRLGLYARSGFERNTGIPAVAGPVSGQGRSTSTELYFYPEDLPETMARMERAGGAPLSALAPRDWGDEAAYYADPDGNVVVLARPSAFSMATSVRRRDAMRIRRF